MGSLLPPHRASPLLLLLLPALFPAATAEQRHGVVFDAGSSGTRIHVYTWEEAGPGGFELVSDDLLKIKPGLSSFRDNTKAAGESLVPLLEYAYTKIPEAQRARTPAYLMATAGLRLVGETKTREILDSVCGTLRTSPFVFQCAWASLLSGYYEGLYGWVTVNYLMRTLDKAATPTVGTIDLGGGSVQIVYEPKHGTRLPEDVKATLPLAGTTKTVYVKSHLGYGLDEARKTVGAVAAKRHKDAHPCLPRGFSGSVSTSHGDVPFTGTGDFNSCVALVEAIFPKAECPLAPCSIQGAHQPALTGSFVGFSYMYDRTKAIGLLDDSPATYGEQRMTIKDIKKGAQRICGMDARETAAKWATHQDGSKSANFCGDAIFVAVMLEKGFGFGADTPFVMTNKISQVEIVWTLGAMLAKVQEGAAGAGGAGWWVALLAAATLALLWAFRGSLFRGGGLLPFR